MSGAPGFRLRGLDLAIDAMGTVEKWLAAERLSLADTLGPEAPPVKRIAGKVDYLRVTISHLRSDRDHAASVDRSPEGQDPEEGLDAKHESAVPKADAQPQSGPSQ